ncbi:tRNA (guanosine(46)-N7)-methyltransferase TrmB [Chitinophaga pendula]|uniref:tRNA (guanosine(46)-N7)-methyltransferase TrmB n=1 Tax=Chitinophaga TaxID=79328 RepID=UPI000BAEF38D|nr:MULTISPECIES: tRNA (guanosine(46)-N7)-methyltransferase TrmB [Chitinophaga]ASZ10613.1 tRNA (guanosine(46)-N7)-methyltransferase TrmB [Chitinophaga sp. MD30]UCJ06412.1 tRNA (guanosine(46)-N7)-methyltransferase TrmB [Chitinophaga pendula]
MGQKKLQRFAEIETFPNVLIYPEGMQGQWNAFFKNNNPLTLELACGKGDYTLGLARRFPDRNFLGVDLKGNRIWKGAKTALEEPLPNAAFLRTQIDKLNNYFNPGEIAEIWITFPDPFLRQSKSKKRLTHPKFLQLFQPLLAPGGTINLKTDSPELYQFTREAITASNCQIIEDIGDVYALPVVPPLLQIQTFYEGMHLADGRTIRYLKFALPAAPLDWRSIKLPSDEAVATGGED